jgi:hypothetical protein
MTDAPIAPFKVPILDADGKLPLKYIPGEFDFLTPDAAATTYQPLTAVAPVSLKARGIVGDGVTNVGAAVAAIISAARLERRRVDIEPGVYFMGTQPLGLSGGVHLNVVASGIARFGGNTDGVIFRWSSAMTGACVTVNAGNVWLEGGIVFDVNGAAATGIRHLGGFECRYDDVRVINAAGIGMHIRAISNTSYERVYVDNCGTATLPAVLIESVSHSLNTLDFDQVHIERSANTALHIGPIGDIGDGTGIVVPEFLRINNLHIENPNDNGGVPNVDPLVKITLARNVCFVNSFLLGGPGALVEHDFAGGTVYDSVVGGIVFVGGTLLGRSAPNLPAVLVKLTRGNRFSMAAASLDNCSASPVSIASTYGPTAFVDWSCVKGGRTAVSMVSDYRTVRDPYQVTGDARVSGSMTAGSGDISVDLRVRGHFVTTSLPPTAAAQPQAGSGAPAPTLVRADDHKGLVSFGTGTTPAAGPQVRVAFSKAFGGQVAVTLTAANLATALLGAPYVATDAAGFTIYLPAAPAASQAATTYQYDYQVGG